MTAEPGELTPAELREEIGVLEAKIERLEADMDQRMTAYVKSQEEDEVEIERLRALVQCLLDEDPNDLAADGGVTVLDVWRKDARAALEPKP